ALKKYGEAALAQEIIGRLPEITRAVAEPLAAISNLTVVSTDGASAVTKTVGQVASEVPAVVKNLTGLDLTALLSGVAGGALADAAGAAGAKPAPKRAPKAAPKQSPAAEECARRPLRRIRSASSSTRESTPGVRRSTARDAPSPCRR